MPRKSRWEKSGVEDGIGQVKLFSWRYFIDFVYQEMLDYETYLWRGQRNDDWQLEPTLGRLIKKAKVAKTKSLVFRQSHLEQFKYAVRGRRGPNPPSLDSENDWWALGQHHGLSTPLLDWTLSPFVAAYFAFIGSGEAQTRHRAVYAIHRPSIEKKATELQIQAEKRRSERKRKLEQDRSLSELMRAMRVGPSPRPEVEFIRPLSDDNDRLVNQGGLFTRSPDSQSLEQWVKSNFAGEKEGYTLMKLLIPNKDRKGCLQTLNRMNINHLTLFPDLYGASKFCNLFGEIEKY